MFSLVTRLVTGRQIAGIAEPSLDNLLAITDRHTGTLPGLIPADPQSPPRTLFRSDIPLREQSMMNLTARQRLRVMPKMLRLFPKMVLGRRRKRRLAAQPLRDAGTALIAALEQELRQAGAQDIGYVRVARRMIFRGLGVPYRQLIVFTVPMAPEPIFSAPSFDCQLEVMDGYARLGDIGEQISRWLEQRGFAAIPGSPLGGSMDYVALGEMAGLGAIGYHGLLISPHSGARLRICTIAVNIRDLPFAASRQRIAEHAWIRDFCAACRKCVRSCPVDAIFPQPQRRDDGGIQCIDHAACRNYFAAHFGCGVCLSVCPFSRSGYSAIQARFKGNPQAPRFSIPLEPLDDRATMAGGDAYQLL